jgi:hypothetical protein
MARLTVGWPVIGGRTADGMDAIYSITPDQFAATIGFGSMALQEAGNVYISGGYISDVTVDSIGSGFAVSGTVLAEAFQSDDSFDVGNVFSVAGGKHIGINDSATSDWIYLLNSPGAERIGIPNGNDFSIITESAPGLVDGNTILDYDGATNTTTVGTPLKVLSNVGFFGTTPIAQITVADQTAIVTTQTAGGAYGTNEQIMIGNLKTDVTNLHTKLAQVITALKDYGIVG